MVGKRKAREGWTFLTNHAAVLLAIFEDPEARLRDIADEVGLTERATHQIITDLAGDGYIKIMKEGRRNFYEVSSKLPLRRAGFEGEDLARVLKSLARRK